MSDPSAKTIDLEVLERAANGYLSWPIPCSRDKEIGGVLSHVLAENAVVRFVNQLRDGHTAVLLGFAQRMASAAARNSDPKPLTLALIALLIAYRCGDDERNALLVFPVVYDAMRRLGADIPSLLKSTRQTVGDPLTLPFMEFLQRSEHDKSLEVMGYITEIRSDGFRYKRTW